jgi:hypothetical protein
MLSRSPAVGDRGTIVEVYSKPELAFEVECCNEAGETIWLTSMYPEELAPDTEATLDLAEVLDEAGRLKFRYSRYMSSDASRWIRHGLFVAYYPDGRVASEVTYEHGAENGPCRDFHINGQVAAEGAYSNGTERGLWKYYAEDGTLESSVDHE